VFCVPLRSLCARFAVTCVHYIAFGLRLVCVRFAFALRPLCVPLRSIALALRLLCVRFAHALRSIALVLRSLCVHYAYIFRTLCFCKVITQIV
jgi:hypothetical protein